jgi:hypothetical protein
MLPGKGTMYSRIGIAQKGRGMNSPETLSFFCISIPE